MGTLKRSNEDTKLDDLAMKSLELMQKIVHSKLKLQEYLKLGTINLAKSRYIMGNRSVSLTQLPSEESAPFRALCTVEHTSVENETDSTVFSVVREVAKPSQRRLQEDNEGEIRATDSSLESPLSCDPIQWFGVLVPQNLRVAQASFNNAIQLSVEIASLQAQLEALRIQFCTLKLERMKISSETSNIT